MKSWHGQKLGKTQRSVVWDNGEGVKRTWKQETLALDWVSVLPGENYGPLWASSLKGRNKATSALTACLALSIES